MWIRRISWIAACVPIGFIALIGISAAYFRWSFGRWPVVYMDSIQGPFADAALIVTAFSTVAVFPSILLLPAVAALRWMSPVRPVLGRWSALFVLGWVAAYTLVIYDPTGYIDWVLD